MDFTVILTLYVLYNMLLGYGTIYISQNYFIIITLSFTAISLIVFYIFNRIASNLLPKISFDIRFAARSISLILTTTLFLLYCLNRYTEQLLLVLITIIILTISLYCFGNLFKIIKKGKEILVVFFRLLKFLFGISLATINIFIVQYYLECIFYFVTKIDLLYPNLIFTDTLYNYKNEIFVVITILILGSWLNLKEKEIFSRIEYMVNVLCFLLYCLAFFMQLL